MISCACEPELPGCAEAHHKLIENNVMDRHRRNFALARPSVRQPARHRPSQRRCHRPEKIRREQIHGEGWFRCQAGHEGRISCPRLFLVGQSSRKAPFLALRHGGRGLVERRPGYVGFARLPRMWVRNHCGWGARPDWATRIISG